jgi:uncharacterized protein (DUF924 family)
MTDDPEQVLSFWFGSLDECGRADDAHIARWWRKDPAFDAEIAERFGDLHAAALRGEREGWLATPRGRLALIIVLDQFSRNMFRGSARAFEGDPRALEVARAGIERGDDRTLAADERMFFYMPFMHSESIEAQDRCVALFASCENELDREAREHVSGARKFAELHREIVQRFGRFPHRNEVLGRQSTEKEREFLQQPGSSF